MELYFCFCVYNMDRLNHQCISLEKSKQRQVLELHNKFDEGQFLKLETKGDTNRSKYGGGVRSSSNYLPLESPLIFSNRYY